MKGKTSNTLTDTGILLSRVAIGSLLAGHGAQKLFGWFGGSGLKGTEGWLESIGLRPGRPWAIMAGASEFGGGLLTLLGFLNPLGPIGVIGAMGMATAKVHWGKPIWVTSGGAELPVTNAAIASALILAGPGKYSLDHLLGTRLPLWVAVPGLVAVGTAMVVARNPLPKAQQTSSQAPISRQAGVEQPPKEVEERRQEVEEQRPA